MRVCIAIFAAVCFLSAIATPVAAQVTDDLDAIGIYFDLAALDYCHEHAPAPPPAGVLEAHLLLTNASDASGLSGWQCRLEIDVPPGCAVFAYAFPTAAVNVTSPPDFAVSLLAPLPHQPVLQLLTITLYVTAAGPWSFSVLPLEAKGTAAEPPRPVYMAADDPGTPLPMYQVSGGAEYPVAVLNGPCDVIGARAATWGGLKTLYR